jgi:small-conductance mechanosensitive channel
MEVEIISNSGLVIPGYQFDGMYIFDMEQILDLCKDEKTSLKEVLKTIEDYSDVSFFDLPELEVIKEFLEIYKPLLASMQSLSVVYFEDNHNQIIEEVYEHFDKNGIDLRGSLIQTP